MAAAAATSISVSPSFLFSLFLKPNHPISSNPRKSHPLNLIASQWPSTRNFPSLNPPSATPPNGKRWKLPALRETLFLLDTTPVEESAQETMLESDPVISVLIIVAFVGLSVLTIGVIYIAVADFLQRREKEKFEKEEGAKQQKKKKGKIRTRAREGPRGFGQKIEEEIDELTE